MSIMAEIHETSDVIYSKDSTGMHIRIWMVDTDGSLKEIVCQHCPLDAK